MIDATILAQAKQLKKEMESAYTIFKRQPDIDNANSWTTAVKTYNDFCVDFVTNLIEDEELSASKKAEVLANIEKYKTCKQCNTDMLYLSGTDNYVASSDFVMDFPGWCFSCLVEYCTTHECVGCTVTTRPTNCPFSEIKKLHMSDV